MKSFFHIKENQFFNVYLCNWTEVKIAIIERETNGKRKTNVHRAEREASGKVGNNKGTVAITMCA